MNEEKKIKFRDSPKPRPQVLRLLGTSRTNLRDSFNIRHAGVANEDTGVHVQSSLVCHSKENDDSFDIKKTHLQEFWTLLRHLNHLI